VFDGVEVEGLWWPKENFNIIIDKPLLDEFGGMFGVSVLLVNDILWV